jgi:hypothetical protein
MNQLITAIRARYRTPGEVMRALALDENLLREENPPEMSKRDKAVRAALAELGCTIAQDASLPEITELLKAVTAFETGSGAEEEEEEIGEEFEDGEDPESEDDAPGAVTEPNSGIPGAEEEEGEEVGTDEPVAKLHSMLEGKFSPEEMARIGELLEKISDPDGEEGDADEHEEHEEPEEEKAEGKDGDEEDDDMNQDNKDLVTRPAMDEAIKAAVADAEKRAKATAKEVRAAENAVRPWVGELAMAFDSAEAVYRKALNLLNDPDADAIHASALPAVLRRTPRPGQHANPAREVSLGMDAATAADFGKMFPNVARIGVAH